MNFLLPTLYILGLYAAYAAGSVFLRARPGQSNPGSNAARPTFPLVTVVLLLVVAIPTTLQFFFPEILLLLQRDYTKFVSGEWWRLITPLVVQDGGVAGAVFNLVSLFLVGSVAESLWGKRNTVILFLVGGIIGEIVAFAWQPVGAGNSVANFSLAASSAIACMTRPSSRFIRVAAGLALGADVILVVLRDIHGAAALAGAIFALVLNRMWYREEQESK